jgi:hypothetical protein
MPQQELLKRVAGLLDGLGIDYLVSGSIASSYYGEPRATHDLDLVVTLHQEDIDALTAAFRSPEFFLSRAAIEEAVQHRSMFNIIAVDGADKIDFWLLKDEPFDQSRFARRRRVRLFDADIMIASPEDMIVMKLRWSHMSGGSLKQRNDIRGIRETQTGRLDWDYIEHWAEKLGVVDELRKIANAPQTEDS